MKKVILFVVLILVLITLTGCYGSYLDDKIPIDGFQETQYTSSLTIDEVTHNIVIIKDPSGFLWYAIDTANTYGRQFAPVINEDGCNATVIRSTAKYEPVENHKISIGEFQVTAYKSYLTVNGESYNAVVIRDPMGFLWYAVEKKPNWQLIPVLTKDGHYTTKIPQEE